MKKIQIKFLLNDLFTLVLAPDSHRNTTAAGKFCFTFTQKNYLFFLKNTEKHKKKHEDGAIIKKVMGIIINYKI